MKKFVLASAVIVTYGLYSLHGHSKDTKVVTTPPATTTQSAPKSSSSSSSASPSSGQTASAAYKDGQYTGSVADAVYGNIQVEATIQGGKITAVQFLQYPNDRPNSVSINQQAMPLLQQEAIQAQSAQVDVVSGATDSSEAFVQSLGNALAQAHS
jgi:uncharacterized protein with FMN-binding domain